MIAVVFMGKCSFYFVVVSMYVIFVYDGKAEFVICSVFPRFRKSFN